MKYTDKIFRRLVEGEAHPKIAKSKKLTKQLELGKDQGALRKGQQNMAAIQKTHASSAIKHRILGRVDKHHAAEKRARLNAAARKRLSKKAGKKLGKMIAQAKEGDAANTAMSKGSYRDQRGK